MADADTATSEKKVKRRKGMPGKDTRPCASEGCPNWAWAQGYCDPHYQKLKALGVLITKRVFGDDLARFHTKYTVNPDTGCWEWKTISHPSGYGYLMTDAGRKSNRAHRFAYERLVGPIPSGMLVCHRCDVRRCVNPEHLFLGSGSDNMRDCAAKGRTASQRGLAGRKLTPQMVSNIRIMYARGSHTMRQLAEVYLVQEAAIWKIVTGSGWQSDPTISGFNSPFDTSRTPLSKTKGMGL